ncbi:MAG: Uncharacterised protein [Flavobacteriia bacterium]|nr:MAG: Uncharacterised protein [Flavobacteriia bacterium]
MLLLLQKGMGIFFGLFDQFRIGQARDECLLHLVGLGMELHFDGWIDRHFAI